MLKLEKAGCPTCGTNTVLHMLAIASEAGIKGTIRTRNTDSGKASCLFYRKVPGHGA